MEMKTVDKMVEHYKMMRTFATNTTMYEEAKWQYISMAKGGSGGEMGFADERGATTCRDINYKGYPDSFFQRVCERMGWLEGKLDNLESYSADPM